MLQNMPAPEMLYNILQMDLENYTPLPTKAGMGGDLGKRQGCGCLRTSEKLRQLLCSFPAPPPPSPAPVLMSSTCYRPLAEDCTECNSANCSRRTYSPIPPYPRYIDVATPENKHVGEFTNSSFASPKKSVSLGWSVAVELMKLVQLSVTATALALYYLVYCYMHLVYYTLRIALYFHEADGPMKITIGVVSVTSTVILFNLTMRLEKYVDIFHVFN